MAACLPRKAGIGEVEKEKLPKRKRKRTGRSVSDKKEGERLSEGPSLSLPTGVWGRTPYLSLRGQEELEVFGCVSILCYEDEKILLRLTRGALRILGKGLTMRTYHGSCMTVGGRISSLDFPEKGAPGEGEGRG